MLQGHLQKLGNFRALFNQTLAAMNSWLWCDSFEGIIFSLKKVSGQSGALSDVCQASFRTLGFLLWPNYGSGLTRISELRARVQNFIKRNPAGIFFKHYVVHMFSFDMVAQACLEGVKDEGVLYRSQREYLHSNPSSPPPLSFSLPLLLPCLFPSLYPSLFSSLP